MAEIGKKEVLIPAFIGMCYTLSKRKRDLLGRNYPKARSLRTVTLPLFISEKCVSTLDSLSLVAF